MPKFLSSVLAVACLAIPPAAFVRAAEAPPEPLRIPVSFDAQRGGLASLALYDETGVLVRTLLYAQPVGQGSQVVQWDGTDDLGRPVKPGVYTPKGIAFAAPPSLRYVMKVGKSGNPPYRTADGKGDWGGNLGAPRRCAPILRT